MNLDKSTFEPDSEQTVDGELRYNYKITPTTDNCRLDDNSKLF